MKIIDVVTDLESQKSISEMNKQPLNEKEVVQSDIKEDKEKEKEKGRKTKGA